MGCIEPISLERLSLSAEDVGTESSSCGAITNQGCCSGQVLVFCSAGALVTKPCAPSDMCGWNALFDLYTCGPTGKGDPSGKVPRDCPPLDLGIVDASSPPDVPEADGGGCGALEYVGCCSGNMLHFCSGDRVLSLNCAKNPLCGWNYSSGFYDCGTSGDVDPKGHYPKLCSEVLGDGGVQLDGALDQGTEQGPSDSNIDIADDGGLDADAAEDGFAAPDGPPLSDVSTLDDVETSEAVGLDASGLDVSTGDFRDIVAAGGGGCSGCSVDPQATGSSALFLLLLMFLAAIIGSGRGNREP